MRRELLQNPADGAMRHQRSAPCESKGRKLAAAFTIFQASFDASHLEALPISCEQGGKQKVCKLYTIGIRPSFATRVAASDERGNLAIAGRHLGSAAALGKARCSGRGTALAQS